MSLFHHEEDKVVISLGGSLLYEEGLVINRPYLDRFAEFVKRNYNKIAAIVVGGGALARYFIQQFQHFKDENKDWIGIGATKQNAHILLAVMREHGISVEEKIIDDYSNLPRFHKLVIGAGWKPGWSTDYDAVLLAVKWGIRRVLNLTRVPGLYDKDPTKHRDAKLISKISWDELYNRFYSSWSPGMNFPIDPKAMELGRKEKIQYIIVNGYDLQNVERAIKNQPFIGTIIE